MGETTTTEKTPKKKEWTKGLKHEFKKIIWPNKESMTKKTVAVVAVTAVLCAIIAGLDVLIQYGVNFLVQ